MNQLLMQLIPYVRNGEVVLKTTEGVFRGIVENLVVYSKAGDFYVEFSDLRATPKGLKSNLTELPCWDIIGVEKER